MELSLSTDSLVRTMSRADVRHFVATCVERSSTAGLRLFVNHDMAQWVGHIRTADRADGVNPTFNPENTDQLTPATSFWLAVRDGSDRVVACIAGRVFTTDDFSHLIRSLKLWYDPVPAHLRQELRLVLPPQVPILAGRVAHIGGLWVHPVHRKTGLSALLQGLAHGLLVDLYEADWVTAIEFAKITDKAALVAAYGPRQMVPCIEEYFPPTGRFERIFLTYRQRQRTSEVLSVATALLRDQSGRRHPGGSEAA